jgi:hypothetical protein
MRPCACERVSGALACACACTVPLGERGRAHIDHADVVAEVEARAKKRTHKQTTNQSNNQTHKQASCPARPDTLEAQTTLMHTADNRQQATDNTRQTYDAQHGTAASDYPDAEYKHKHTATQRHACAWTNARTHTHGRPAAPHQPENGMQSERPCGSLSRVLREMSISLDERRVSVSEPPEMWWCVNGEERTQQATRRRCNSTQCTTCRLKDQRSYR